MGKDEVEAAIRVLEKSISSIDSWLLILTAWVAIGVAGQAVFGVSHWLKERQLRPLRVTQAQLHENELAALRNDTARLTAEAEFSRAAIASADERAAIASQRAAEADQKAAEAQLELAKFRKPRSSVLKYNTTRLTEKLKPFAGTQFDCAFNRSSGEQAEFWWDLQPALIASGWINVPWKYGTSSGGWSQGSRPETGEVAVTNVEIHLHKEQRQNLAPAAAALISALNDIGIEAKDAGFNVHNSNDMAIHILIGEKR